MTAIVNDVPIKIKREHFEIRAWVTYGKKRVQEIFSPEFSTLEKASDFLKKHANELPKTAEVHQICILR